MKSLGSCLDKAGVQKMSPAIIFPVVTYRCTSWTIKKAECQRTDAFELWCWKRLESPLDSKEIKPVNPKGNQPWVSIRRTIAEAEAIILWPLDMKSRFTGKDPEAGKVWRQKEKGMAEDERVGWHLWLKGHEFQQTPGGLGNLGCCRSCGCKELDPTEWLSNNKDWSAVLPRPYYPAW